MAKRNQRNFFQDLAKSIQDFTRARDWEKFHSPKNLSMAMAVECAELMEHFQWLTESESQQLKGNKKKEIAMELADIQIYLIRMSQVLDVDLLTSVAQKLVVNGRKYPVAKARGSAKKYTDLT